MHKVTIGGIPFDVGEPAELLDAFGSSPKNIHMVVRIADEQAPYPDWLAKRLLRVPCEQCREICRYDPASIVDPQASMVCMQCVSARLKDSE